MNKSILKSKLEIFQQLFPDEKIVSIIEDQGMEHYVLDINDNWICKIAKDQTEGLKIENKVLRFLEGKIKTNIPNVAYYEPGFLIYRKLAGIELSNELYENLNPAQKDRLADDLAIFLQELHTINPVAVQALQLPWCDWPWPAQKLLEQANLIHDPEVQKLFNQFMPNYIAIKPSINPVLIHNDLNSRNILIDPKTGALSGIIDFTDVAFQDVYFDLRIRGNCVPELVEAVAQKYAQLIGIKLDFKRLYLYYLATEFSRYIQFLQENKLDQLPETKARIVWASNKINL